MHSRKTQVSITRCESYQPSLVREAVERTCHDLGGIGAFVSLGQTVLLKPNLLSPRPADAAVTTHPEIVRALALLCVHAGASRVWIGDSCAGDHEEVVLWQKTGMQAVADETGARLKSFKDELVSRSIDGGQVPIPAWLDEVDVCISLPKLKTHGLTVMTCAIKNMYGLVAGGAKGRYHAHFPSPRAMSDFLVRIYAALKPDLTLVDAVVAMEGEGPSNGAPREVGLLIAGEDGVAVDTVCARFVNRKGKGIPMLEVARRHDVGETSFEALHLCGNGVDMIGSPRLRPSIGRVLQLIPESLFRLATRVLACQPRIDQNRCVQCGACARICSQNAISRDAESGAYEIDASRCIMCMCCTEACPYNAVIVRSPWTLPLRLARLLWSRR